MVNLNVQQIEFKSVNTEATVTGWIYHPGGSIRAIVQICHGMSEHMGRYHDFMRFLARNGYVACGIDHLGHGQSAQEGKMGFFAEQDGWRLLLENQRRFQKIVRRTMPEIPLVMLGHSMGSFVARLYTAKYPKDLNGLILSGTGRGTPALEVAIQMANHSAQKNGPGYVDENLNRMAFGLFNRPFRSEHPKSGWLSRDLEQVRRYASDPLCSFIFTASAFRDLFILIRNSNEKNCFSGMDPETPLLVFSGNMDPLGERGKGVRRVYEQYVKEGVADAQLFLYEGGRHEMLNEINRQQVFDDVLGWLNDHFPEVTQEPEEPQPDDAPQTV